MSLVVVAVLAAGLVAAAMYFGYIGGPGGTDVAITSPTPCVTAAAKPLDPRKVKVNVYNATSRSGLAAGTADELRAKRFSVGVVANDPTGAKVSGTALVRYGPKGAASAKLVAAQVKGAKLVRDRRTNATVDLVLGNGFNGLSSVVVATAAPSVPCAATSTPTRSGVAKTRPTTTPR